jgi:membrane fusion protein (multidrug efflux system)
MSKKKKIVLISSAIAVIMFLLALPKINFSGSQDNSPHLNADTQVLVNAHILKPEVLGNNIITSGTVLANEDVDLKSEVAGKITQIAFKEGSRVKKGDLLVKINDAELQAQLRREQYKLELLKDKEYRQKKLLEREAISQEEYDDALNQLNVSRSEVDLIRAQIEKTEIRAPFDGIVGLKNVSEGSFINSSSVIASLQNINPIKIDFSIPERYAGSVKIGDKVNFKVVGEEEQNEARVYAIEPKIDPVTRTLKIRAIYSNPAGKILPGSFADVELILDKIEDALMVPTQAVVPELKGQKVYLYKSGKVVSQKIETGIRTDIKVQATSGLSPNDTLITSGILQVKDGIPVKISEFN